MKIFFSSQCRKYRLLDEIKKENQAKEVLNVIISNRKENINENKNQEKKTQVKT